VFWLLAPAASIRVLKLPAKEGETWEFASKDKGDLTLTDRYTTGKEEEIEVPAGKFKAIRVDMETVSNGRTAVRMTYWHAPGVGVVKEVRHIDRQPDMVWVLKAFTRGEK
jgi:hypothetical protein